MKRNFRLLYVLLVFMASSSALEAEELYQLVNQRLHYIKDVAVYKAKQNLPVEDKAQEQAVLEAVMTGARQNGLDADSVADFFSAQIEVGKSIQQHYHQQWVLEQDREGMPLPNMMANIRPQIANITNEIIQAFPAYLTRYGSHEDSDRKNFYNALTTEYLTEDDKKQLFDALLKVKQAK